MMTAPARRPRTNQPVRRRSVYAGEKERRLWARHNTFTRADNNAIMAAAEQYDREGKAPGSRNGRLGHIALDLLRRMLRLRGRLDGRLDPSIDWLARELRRSRTSIVAALKRLRDAGFIDWLRRSEPIEDPDPFGPQVRQISNAYWLLLPEKIAALVDRIRRRASAAVRAVIEQREHEARAHRPATDSIARLGDSDLAATFRRMAAALGDDPEGAKRDFTERSE